jgi:O-methyltransferase
MRYSTELMPTIDNSEGRKRINFPEIEDPLFWNLYGTCARFSLLNVTGFYNLFQSAHYIARNKIPGDVVECGCFTGGAAIFLDLCFKALGEAKPLILFDTFEGAPIEHNDMVLGVRHSGHKLPDFEESVRLNIAEAGARAENFTLIRGNVLDTLPVYKPGPIAMLRLDTDFYESTKIEFETLYPKLVSGGVLIVDDYGLFQGSRRATDEYFKKAPKLALLNRIDIGIWAGVKP